MPTLMSNLRLRILCRMSPKDKNVKNSARKVAQVSSNDTLKLRHEDLLCTEGRVGTDASRGCCCHSSRDTVYGHVSLCAGRRNAPKRRRGEPCSQPRHQLHRSCWGFTGPPWSRRKNACRTTYLQPAVSLDSRLVPFPRPSVCRLIKKPAIKKLNSSASTDFEGVKVPEPGHVVVDVYPRAKATRSQPNPQCGVVNYFNCTPRAFFLSCFLSCFHAPEGSCWRGTARSGTCWCLQNVLQTSSGRRRSD